MKIGIVDDELEMRLQLQEYIQRLGEEERLQVACVLFEGSESLLRDYTKIYDILIFDIDMPGINGLDCARRVRQMDENVVILFVTNIAQYAINGYEVEAVDYIIKPVGYYDFSLKFKKALRRAARLHVDQVVLSSNKGPVRVEVPDILYVEVFAHYLVYHARSRDIQVRGSMKEHEAFLRGHGFSRIHKSFLVNLRHIENIRSGQVLLSGLENGLPLGRAFKEEFMNDYLRFLRE